MDYKKAYTEAKAAMRQRVDAGFIDEVYAREIFKDFEDEDEIIKKELIAAFQNGVAYNSISKERAKDYISWIEKHKQTPQWMIDFLNEHRSHFGVPMDYDEHRDVDGKLLCIQQWLEGNFVEQKIQPKFKVGDWIRYKTNPDDVERVDCVSDNHYILDIKGKCNTVLFTCQDLWELVEYKPAELSEEDEKMIENIIDTINMSIEDCDVDDIGTKARFSLEKERDWLKNKLKSLKGRVQPQPTEWSEEDKGNLLDVKCIIDKVWHNQDVREEIDHSGEELESLWHWLGNIWQRIGCPQPTWKPSEEQLTSLAWIIEYGNTSQTETLKKLLEQLKAL